MPELRGLVGETEQEERKGNDIVAEAALSGSAAWATRWAEGALTYSAKINIPTGGCTSRMILPDSSTLEGGD